MPQPQKYLLDTNVLILYARGSAVARAMEDHFRFQETPFKPLVSIVSIGEALAFAQRNNWGEKKLDGMGRFMASLVEVPIDSRALVNAYAEISVYCRSIGRQLSKNDLWIAATAHVTRAHLVTSDRDFLPLAPQFLEMSLVDMATGRVLP